MTQITEQLRLPLYAPVQAVIAGLNVVRKVIKTVSAFPFSVQMPLSFSASDSSVVPKRGLWSRLCRFVKTVLRIK